jgi:ubiquinone/menaquinone biosynthesis C-methylase UbiE
MLRSEDPGRSAGAVAQAHWLLEPYGAPDWSSEANRTEGYYSAEALGAFGAAKAAQVTPERILEIGTAFWSSKLLLSAVELGLFNVLADGFQTGPEIEQRLALHPRATYDFLDALVALGLLERHGDGPEGLYRNTAETAAFLNRGSPTYVGGILEMANARLYRFWADLTDALRTGRPQNEVKHSGRPMFEELYADPARLEQFMDAMTGVSRTNFEVLAEKFDFSPYRTLADIGGATGQLACIVAARHPHLACRSYDLPVVRPIAERRIAERGLAGRVEAGTIDFLTEELPQADLITMGMVLHDWNLEQKKRLIAKAYRALPPGGALVAIENLIDDARRTNAFGLLMSLNMLIEFGDAFDFTGADFAEWCFEVGFSRCEVLPLAGPASAAVAFK